MKAENLKSSFRDPGGFLFTHEGVLYRQVNEVSREDFNLLHSTGLYDALVAAGLLVEHEDVGRGLALSEDAYTVIRPTLVPFISYPYEWSFGQLKDAALATLSIQKKALEHGMSLKDSNAYNIQFLSGRPVMIDTLSFKAYREGEPWVAYRQFCQHFLAPLALMVHRDIRMGLMLREHIDGIPLDLASGLMPRKSFLNIHLLAHLHLHSRSQKHYANKQVKACKKSFSKRAFNGLIDSLTSGVEGLKWDTGETEWAEYYEQTNYSDQAMLKKMELVEKFLGLASGSTIWDMGANQGNFSRIAKGKGMFILSMDVDPSAVELNYRKVRSDKETDIHPLVIDLTNPSPSLGWMGVERMGLMERGPADIVFALALIHHLAITNNVSLGMLCDFFARLCRWLIIEFVPKSDSQVKRLLFTREDIFPGYTQDGFEKEFSRRFRVVEQSAIEGTERTLYLMERL
jgi:hypothetical protein